VTPYERVLAEPGSIEARWILARSGDVRATLIEKQLARRELRMAGNREGARAVRKEIDAIIAREGKALAGPIADLVSKYEFERGVVAFVALSGEAWLATAARLFELAPIQHVEITKPLGKLAAIFAVPEFAKLSTLIMVDLKDEFGDAGAIALARSPHASNLKWIDLTGNRIGDPGTEAIAASPYLEHAVFMHFENNPADPTPWANELDGDYGRPMLACKLETMFGRRPWLDVPSVSPPNYDEIASR